MRKSLRALCVAVALGATALLFVAVPALATSTHVFASSFGEAGSGDGQLSLTESTFDHGGGSGVAVNSSTHDVYVADTGNHRIDEFSASGAFVRAWGWGVADGSTEALQSCTSGCHAGLAGGGTGQLDEPTFVAVDNSGGPSEGDVYVADRVGSGVPFVTKFTATGGYLSSNDGSGAILPIPGPFGRSIGGIAVDGSGDLWVIADDKGGPGDPRTGAAIVFEFAQDGSFITAWNTFRFMFTQMGLAIDSANDLYLLSFYKFASSGTLLLTTPRVSPYGIAVDAVTNDLFVDEGSPANHGEGIGHYAPGCELEGGLCAPTDIFGASGELNRAGELAVDSHDDTVYVADIGHQRVAVFGRKPDVGTGQLGSRTPTTATLSGTVNPDNTPIGDCHFDYVADSEYNPAEANPYASGGSAPCDVTPSGATASTVHATVSGLTPGAIYHFRLEATNVYGTSFGGDVTGPGTPPAIKSSSADDVTSSSASFHAVIDPEGGDTTYRFEYGTDTSYGSVVPVPDGDIGSSIGAVSVSRHVQGLTAGATYHYRVVAHNLIGSSFGPDRAIATQPAAGGAGSDGCPNAGLRAEQLAAALPDCRAYEQVSPASKNGSPVLGPADNEHVWQSSPDGSAVTYTSSGIFAGAQSGGSVVFPYLSSRTQGGWSTHNLLPPQALGLFLPFVTSDVFSSDLSKSLLFDGGATGQDDPPLVPGEPANNQNLFRRDNSTGSYQLMDITPPGVTPAEVAFQSVSASADLSHVVFAVSAQLTADSPAAGTEPHLYVWSEGAVHLLGVFPNGTPMPASLRVLVPRTSAGNEATATVLDNHALSADGSRIFFEAVGVYEGTQVQDVYLREGGSTTVQVDASHGPGPGGGGSFVLASSDGSRAFLTADASSGLTNDTVAGSGTNLYRYDTNGGALTDLTPVPNAEVQGVLGASEDGSYIYYVANGVLASGASPGNCSSTSPVSATNCNLYLSHEGTTTFIASLNGEDLSDWYKNHRVEGTAAVSPDGRYLAFQSLNGLTGYDNLAGNGVQCGTDELVLTSNTKQPRCTEVFVYDAAAGPTGRVSCASCNPSGGAPSVSSLIAVPQGNGGDQAVDYLPRYLSDSGQLFFNSPEALVPQDTNHQWDVYEYEPGGVGSCQLAQGCDSLISSGTSPEPSIFRDASLTGDDVFFTTTDRLVAQDGDGSFDLYDAKVNGGIASQNEAPARECEGESCKPAAAGQPAAPGTSSSDFTGAGNLTPSVSVPRHVKTVKKKHKPKKHSTKKNHRQKKRHRARGRRANYNRGGAK